jgi:hypothetical protein
MARRHYDWDGLIAQAAARPGSWIFAFPNHPTRLAKRIRLRQHPKLRRDDGMLEASVLNEYREAGAGPRGDIWVRWIPSTPTSRKEQE